LYTTAHYGCAIIIFYKAGRLRDSNDHGGEKEHGEAYDKREADLCDELVLAEVLSECYQSSEMGRRREGAYVEDEDEVSTLNTKRALRYLQVFLSVQ
jgi:hypothetical protein